MALPTTATVANLAREYVVPAWYPGGFVDQLIRKIRFEKVEQPSETIEWNQATSLPSVSKYDAGATTLGGTAMDTTKFTLTMRRIGDVAEIDTFYESACSEPNNQLQVQIQAKKVGVIRTLGSLMMTGTGANFSSLDVQIVAGQKITLTAPTKDDIHRLVHKARPSDGFSGAGPDCLAASERVVRQIIKLMEDSAGGGLTYSLDPDLGVPVPMFHGLPVYIAQLPDTTIYALKLTGPTGIRIVHGSGRSSEFGIEVREVPMQATVSKRGAFVGGFYSLIVPEELSIARIDGITTLTVPAL